MFALRQPNLATWRTLGFALALLLSSCGGGSKGGDTAVPPSAPTIATQPKNASTVAGLTATFTVTANGTAPLAYQWRKNGTPLAGATAATYTSPATWPWDSSRAWEAPG